MNDEVVHQIAEMNRARMRAKGRIPGVDEPYERRICGLASSQALVGKLVVGGEFVAGALCLKVANEYYLYAVAHDPSYDRYDVGFLGLYKTIIECIELGGAVFHFLWGESEYKYRLMGVKVDLYEVTLHRTRLDQRCWGLRSRARSPLSHKARAGIKSEIRRRRWIAVPLKWIVGLTMSRRRPESPSQL